MDKDQLRDLITRVLKEANLYSMEAVELLMLTAAVESNLGKYIKQKGGGPALGIFQMEPSTETDIHNNFLIYRKDEVLQEELSSTSYELETDLRYSILMARVHYLRVKEPIPKDLGGMARYWKKYYNTYKGKGTVGKALQKYQHFA